MRIETRILGGAHVRRALLLEFSRLREAFRTNVGKLRDPRCYDTGSARLCCAAL